MAQLCMSDRSVLDRAFGGQEKEAGMSSSFFSFKGP